MVPLNPVVQVMHEADVGGDHEPLAQFVQTVDDVAVEYVPAEHAEQAGDPDTAEKVPTMQPRHVAEFVDPITAEAVPTAQAPLQAVTPDTDEYVPAAQLVHAVEPAKDE